MPKIIKSGVNYIPDIPDIPDVPTADGITIIDSEGVWSAVQQEIPQPDEVTIIYNQENKLEAVSITSNWEALENSEGFISNKPNILKGSDYDNSGVIINDTTSNEASGINSVALGSGTKAIGAKSHAEGYLTTAEGENSHAEGESTRATAKNTHAEGVGTIAPNIMGAHVQGRYNANVSNENFIDIVGYGSNNSNRKNISALTTDGRLILSNSITIGADNQSHGGYTIPIPTGLDYGKKYVVSFDPDLGTITWDPFELEVDDNKYGYNGATASNPGPFTIYEGTAEPSSSLGKPGDIYFKHN